MKSEVNRKLRFWNSFISVVIPLCYLVFMTGCSIFVDPATSIAYDIERGVKHLENKEDSVYIINHNLKKRAPKSTDIITVEFNMINGAVGTLCKDSDGSIVQTSGTRYHCNFVEIPKTLSITKSVDSTLKIELARRQGIIIVKNIY